MRATDLEAELTKRGLVVLAVLAHPSIPDLLVVYLHGNAGQWIAGRARRRVARVPGTVRVISSAQTPTILLARVQPTLVTCP